jgi:hypothetical protein
MPKKALLSNILFLLFASSFAQEKKNYQISVIGFYNLENFYDTINQKNVNDEEFIPEGPRKYNSYVYKDKIERLSEVLAKAGTEYSPDGLAFFGVAEIENESVLFDLVNYVSLKQRGYKIIHYDSPDDRGVDVGFIYNPKYFKAISSRSLRVILPPDKYAYTAKELLDRDSICRTEKYNYACESPIFIDSLKALPPKTKINRMVSHRTRDVLWVVGEYLGEEMHVFVNHWPSRRGGEEASAPGRAIAANVSKQVIDSLMVINPETKVVLMGDLNDDPVSPSVAKVLGAKDKIEKVNTGGLFNPWVDFYKKGIGTLAYNDSWNLFDQIIISHGFLPKEQKGVFFKGAHIFNRDFMIQQTGKYKGYPLRTWNGTIYNHGYSDHFPTYITLLKRID